MRTPVSSHVDEAPALEARGLSKSFAVPQPVLDRWMRRKPAQVLRAVDNVSFSVDRGKTMSLVGESGCGKSTIAKLVTGLHRPDSGEVLIDGTDVTRLRGRRALRPFGRRLQMIFQDPYASLNPRWRVGDIVAEPIKAFDLESRPAAVLECVEVLLEQVGLTAADAQKYPHEFSGGQRQRIAIARALGSEPEFLVCDEPTSALDVSVQAQILNLLADLQRRLGLGYLFISHNLAVVYHISHHIGVMYLGRLVESGPSDQVFSRPRHPYTRLLLETVPTVEGVRRRRPPIVGEVPNPINPPSGCVFHPRCRFARERCIRDVPHDVVIDGVAIACHGVTEGWIDDPFSPAVPDPAQTYSVQGAFR